MDFNFFSSNPGFLESFLSNDNLLMEQRLQIIKDQGCSLFDGVKVVRDAFGLSLSEADKLVMTSNVWPTEVTLQLREEFFDILEDCTEKGHFEEE